MESQNQDGFSMVEIMVSMLLVAMVIAGALGTQREGLRLGIFGQDVTDDTVSAAQLAELIRLHAPEVPAIPLPLTVDAAGFDSATAGLVTAFQRWLTLHAVRPQSARIHLDCRGLEVPVCQACLDSEGPSGVTPSADAPVCSQPVML